MPAFICIYWTSAAGRTRDSSDLAHEITRRSPLILYIFLYLIFILCVCCVLARFKSFQFAHWHDFWISCSVALFLYFVCGLYMVCMASTHALLSNQPHLVGGQTIAGGLLVAVPLPLLPLLSLYKWSLSNDNWGRARVQVIAKRAAQYIHMCISKSPLPGSSSEIVLNSYLLYVLIVSRSNRPTSGDDWQVPLDIYLTF